MEPTKTYNNVRNEAQKLQQPLVEFLKTHLDKYGNVVDQLRVLGYVGQALVDMANSELTQLKLLNEQEEREKVKVYQ